MTTLEELNAFLKLFNELVDDVKSKRISKELAMGVKNRCVDCISSCCDQFIQEADLTT